MYLAMDWTSISIAIIGIISTIISHLLSKHKYKQEISSLQIKNKSLELDNRDKSLDFYKNLTESTNQYLIEILNHEEETRKENYTLREMLADTSLKLDHMKTLLCTNLPCTARVQDSSIIDCIYLKTIENNKNEKQITE